MTAVVFVGPTLSAGEVSEHLDATILPPVQQGDIYRAAKDNPCAIGIIDGFFDGVPSVWHKEFLWAMEQGITVFGSASMGALRAAELSEFGMIGIGQIFQDYQSGTLEDDDEVAVLHSPAELGFQPLSEPMVSIRATVSHAVDAGVLNQGAAEQVLDIAKGLNYRDRTWDALFDTTNGVLDLSAFRDWLPAGKVDAKADDAREMLAAMAAHLAGGSGTQSQFRVERTLAWRELRARIDAEASPQTSDAQMLVNELRLTPKRYTRLRDKAALTLLAREDTDRRGDAPDRDALVQKMSEHRVAAGLTRQADVMQWLQSNDLTPQQYEGLLADRSRTDSTLAALKDQLDTAILAELRHEGHYVELRDRAAQKAWVLADRKTGLESAESLSRMRLLIWYFETRLDQTVPDDLESYAAALGLDGRDALIELIESEFLFCQLNGGPANSGPSD